MIMRHSFILATFALAALSAVMPHSASADVPTRTISPMVQSNKPVVSDTGTKTIDGASPVTGGASTGGYQKAPFEPNQVCFSNCTPSRQYGGGQKPAGTLAPGGMPTGSSLTRRQ